MQKMQFLMICIKQPYLFNSLLFILQHNDKIKDINLQS